MGHIDSKKKQSVCGMYDGVRRKTQNLRETRLIYTKKVIVANLTTNEK